MNGTLKMLILICASGELFILPENSQSPMFLKHIRLAGGGGERELPEVILE